ncbi:MAG: UvrD-helicase domain-containing protein [Oscillospiraceae bacterium]|nr:UvrD-helicase domain-containing protein [Oscillospiraceae bacterium]
MHPKDVERFLNARRTVIAAHYQNLNPMQREAVMTTEGPLLLLAGAGSGKTTVLIHRISNLIRFGRASDSDDIPDWVTEEDVEFLCAYAEHPEEELAQRADSLCALNPANPWNVIAITFTNKAANELKERLEHLLGEEALDIWAMTFHSACCRILRRDIDRLGYDRSFTIYDTSDSEKVMKEVIRDMGFEEKSFPAKSVLNAISSAKDQMISPKEYRKTARSSTDFRADRIAQAYEEYQNRLKSANAVDFDDIILLTVQLLQDFDDVREYYQKKFRYVLIDEYQDTNHLQYLLATLLSGRYENICVVGDDDQSIYRFRGATISNILDFEKQYSVSKVIRLEQNYRSTKYILDAANSVIVNNKGRKGKKLWTANDQGDKISVYEANSESDEAAFVASQINSGIVRGNNFRDYAILYRTNAQSNAMEQAFKRSGIPYRIIGGTRFFDRAEVKDMLAYLCVINNRTDDLRLRRIINVPARGIGAKTIETAQRQADAAGRPLYDIISDPKGYPSLEKAVGKLTKFTAIIESLRSDLKEMQLPEFYDEVMSRSGYLAMLDARDDVESRSRKENILELKSSIISYVQEAESPTLAGFLEEVSLYTDIERYDQDADAAVMMTMHSAKGLEFPCVFLVGMEEGLFPGMKVLTDPEELEEERRLCYVAITRAKKRLYLSYAKQRMLYGRTTFNRPSRFLGEIPDECLNSRPKTHRSAYQSLGYGERTYTKPKQPIPQRTTNVPLLELQKGDQVVHTAFGPGLVISILKMNGDALLEIAFDQVGTKRLMLKAAGPHLKKK